LRNAPRVNDRAVLLEGLLDTLGDLRLTNLTRIRLDAFAREQLADKLNQPVSRRLVFGSYL
jgi:hypothetical protein